MITIYVLIIITNKIFYYISLSEDHAFYFESNSYHHRISLTELEIKEHLLEGFMPYIETMKSIIIHNGENDQSLLDTFLNINETKSKIFNLQKFKSLIRSLKYYTVNIKLNS